MKSESKIDSKSDDKVENKEAVIVMTEPKQTVKTIPSIKDIEQFIIDNGSEDLNTFGGLKVGGKFIQQVPDEASQCIKYLLDSNAKITSYLEVGAAAGGTTFLFNHYFHPSQIVLVDNNSHPRCWFRNQTLSGIDYVEIINDSQSEDAIRRTSKYAPFDFIILDAVHSYMETMMDVIHYSPFLSPGGYLFLHDSVWAGGEVARVVRELRAANKFEFINEWISETHFTNPCGIALFREKGGKV